MKNIAEPVRAYRVEMAYREAEPPESVVSAEDLPLPFMPSVAVLDAALGARPGAFTGRERRCITSGCCARAMGADRREASHASTSLKSHTTHRGESAKRRGNSPRCSIS